MSTTTTRSQADRHHDGRRSERLTPLGRTGAVPAGNGRQVDRKSRRPDEAPAADSRDRSGEREAHALGLRRLGAEYDQIVQLVGLPTAADAYTAVQAELDRTPRESREEQWLLELERLDALQLAIWDRLLEGDLEAVKLCLAISCRRCVLLGIDGPPLLDLQGPLDECSLEGGSPETPAPEAD